MLLPASATPDAARLISARALRGFADGFVSVYLAAYLRLIGYTAIEIGALVAAMLVGSAVLTLAVGLLAHRVSSRRILFVAVAIMAATGIGFALISNFWLLIIVAFIGTLNPSAGDVSVFLPTEQSILVNEVSAADRTALFARYNVGGSVFGAFGALVSGLPEVMARRFGWDVIETFRGGFVLYSVVALGIVALYSGMHDGHGRATPPVANAPLKRSRPIVLRLTVLFALDSFGGGFAIDSLLVLWLFLRFGLSLQTVGTIFFGTRILAGLSQLFSARLAARFGLIETMVFTHIPASIFLVLAAFMPNAKLAVTFLLLRMAFSSMDVPARQSYVMAVVPPEERTAAASMTNVPRSLTSAISPLIAGSLLQLSTFGWPLVAGGVIKILYDLLLLRQFRHIRPTG
jgi:MFS family permease